MSNLDVNFDLVAERSILNAFHHHSIDPRLRASRLRLRNIYYSVFFRTLVRGAACLLLFLLPFLEHQHSFTQSSDYRTREDETETSRRNFSWASFAIEFISLFVLSLDAILKLMTKLCYRNECTCRSIAKKINCSGNFSTYIKWTSICWPSFFNTCICFLWTSTGCSCFFSTCFEWAQLFIYGLALLISWMSFYAGFGILVYLEILHSYGKVLDILTFIRQLLRPIFLIVQVTMIKKILKAIFYTSIQLISVILLLFLVIFLFMMIGLAIFPRHLRSGFNSSLAVDADTVEEGDNYFNSTSQAFWSLLVYLTTANSPDILTLAYKHHRAYFAYFSAFFLISNYLLLKVITALYAARFMSFFKESMKRTYSNRIANLAIAFSAMTRCAFNENKTVSSTTVKKVTVQELNLISEHDYHNLCNRSQENLNWQAFKKLFLRIFANRLPTENNIMNIYRITEFEGINNRCASCFFLFYLLCRLYINIFSLPFAVLHVIVLTAVLTAEYENSLTNPHSGLVISSLFFSCLLLFEFAARRISLIEHFPRLISLVIMRPRCNLECLYSFLKWLFLGYNLRTGYALKNFVLFLLELFDIILLLVIIVLGFVHVPCLWGGTDDNCLGISNLVLLIQINLILVAFRMFRMLTLIPSFAIIIRTLLHTLILLFPFLVLGYLLYYEFAIIGIALFRHTNLTDVPAAAAMECGTYQNLEYYPYNFGDYGSSLVVLWNLMIVNNWHIIVEAYVQASIENVRGYFVVWWLITETILNGVIYGVLLEIAFGVLNEFFELTASLKREKSYWRKFLLVLKNYVWWGKSNDSSSILDSWNVYDVIHKTVKIDDKDLEAITKEALEDVKKNSELEALYKKPDFGNRVRVQSLIIN